MAPPYLILTDVDSNIYNFLPNFQLSENVYSANTSFINHSYNHGARNIGDNFSMEKIVNLRGYVGADSLAAYETAERALKQACRKGGTLTLSNDTVSRYLSVSFKSISEKFMENKLSVYQYVRQYDIEFYCEFPFWQASSQTTDANVVAGNDDLSIENTGSDHLVKPVIQIIANQAVNVPSAYFRNDTDGNMTFTYADASFVVGDTVEIDCDTGTVTRNAGATNEYFTGAYLRLLPGTNDIRYEGAACTINFIFRKIYI